MADWVIEASNAAFSPEGQFTGIQDFKLDIALNKVRTFQMKVRLDNTLAPFITSSSSTAPIYIKARRNNVILFNGPVASVQEAGESDNKATLQINATGPEAVFGHRLVGLTASPTVFASGTELAVRFKELLAAQNARTNGETHIDYTSGPIQSSSKNAYESPSFRLLSEILTDMYNNAEGFDWTVYPQTETAKKIGRLEIQDVIGSQRLNAEFHWGGGRSNVTTFNRIIDTTSLANLLWNVSSAGPEAAGAPTIKKESLESQQIWGLQEAMVPLSALNIGFREAITQEALNYRKTPKQTISFTPSTDDETGRVPVFGVDFNIGDFVPFAAIYEDVTRIKALMRCWGATFSKDVAGKETQTLLTSEE